MNAQATAPLIAHTPPALPVAQVVIGRSPEAVATLMPRLFNLCRGAQSMAVRMALGLPLSPDAVGDLQRDIRRDHALFLGVLLPPLLDVVHAPDIASLQTGHRLLPETGDAFDQFLQGADPLAHLLAAVAARFPAGIATTSALALPDATSILGTAALDNTVATRHRADPVMRHVAAHYGQGPFWRVLSRVLDLSSPVPTAIEPRQGLAIVPASRGLYAVEAEVQAGRVTRFRRRTPTDHLLAKGGILEQSLRSCPAEDAALLLAILDPCVPVQLKEAAVA